MSAGEETLLSRIDDTGKGGGDGPTDNVGDYPVVSVTNNNGTGVIDPTRPSFGDEVEDARVERRWGGGARHELVGKF